MKKSDLKKMIKPLVKECLTEIFAEMHLETIVEGVVNKRHKKPHNSRHSLNGLPSVLEEAPSQPPEISAEEKKAMIMEKLGIDDQVWSNIYSDTADSENPVLTGEDKPELVSERDLQSSGLLKEDYSKFL